LIALLLTSTLKDNGSFLTPFKTYATKYINTVTAKVEPLIKLLGEFL